MLSLAAVKATVKGRERCGGGRGREEHSRLCTEHRIAQYSMGINRHVTIMLDKWS